MAAARRRVVERPWLKMAKMLESGEGRRKDGGSRWRLIKAHRGGGDGEGSFRR